MSAWLQAHDALTILLALVAFAAAAVVIRLLDSGSVINPADDALPRQRDPNARPYTSPAHLRLVDRDGQRTDRRSF